MWQQNGDDMRIRSTHSSEALLDGRALRNMLPSMKRARRSPSKLVLRPGNKTTSLQAAPKSAAAGQGTLAVGLALVVVVLLVYGRAATFNFTNYDDDEYITDNSHVLTGLSIANLQWAFTGYHAANWHPVTWLSHMMDVQLLGLKPAGHHLVNVGFHCANSVLMFLLLVHLTGARWRSAFVAALFALHPLHVESVVWVSERKDLLSTFFALLTVGAYVRYAKGRDKTEVMDQGAGAGTAAHLSRITLNAPCFYAAALLFFTLGLMSKPMLVTLPFVLLLLDYWPLGRLAMPAETRDAGAVGPNLWKRWAMLLAEKLPFLVLVVVSSTITLAAQQKAMTPYPFVIRLENALVAYAAYILAMLWPVDLAPIYPHPASHLPLWKILCASTALAGISIALLLGRRRRPYLPVGWLWYLGTLVPVIGLIQVGVQARADRYTYLPLTGLFIIIAWGAADLARHWRVPKTALAAVAGLVLSAMSALTFTQTGYWRDSRTLFTHTLAVTQGNFQAHCNLGDALARGGQCEEALTHYERALQIWPSCRNALVNMGNTLALLKRPREAAECFKRALPLDPACADILTNLGNTAAEQGQWDEAVDCYTKSIRLAPSNNGDVYVNLGYVLQMRKRFADAEEAFANALRTNPGNTKARQALSELLKFSPHPVNY